MYANRSLYQYHHWVAGILFGAGNLYVIKIGHFKINDLRLLSFYGLAFIILAILYYVKYINEKKQVPLFELERDHIHILCDFLCAVGSVSVFTLLTYNVFVSNKPFLKGYTLSPEGFLLVSNIIIFVIGYIGLKVFANEERRQAKLNNATKK